MAIKYKKKWSALLIITEVQIRNTMCYLYYPLEWLKSRKQVLWSTGQNVEKLELSYIAGGNAKWYHHFENTFAFFKS